MGLMDKMADIAKKTGGTVHINPYTGTSIKYTTNSGSSSNKSSSKASSSSGSSANTVSNVDYYAQAQAQAAAEAERLRAQQEAIAKKAYKRNMSALQDAYSQKADLLKQNYDSTVGTLDTSYDNSKNNVNTQSNKALQEAYINRMLSQKNLAQNMSAQGISGGMSETTQAGLFNNYGNARNNIETTRSDNLADLEATHQNNLAAALQQYNNQMAQDAAQKAAYQMQLESDLANAIANSYTGMYQNIPSLTEAYTTQMQALIDNQGSYTPVQATANNGFSAVDTQSALDGVNPNYYANYAKKLKQLGYSDEQIVTALSGTGLSNANSIVNILNQLY